MLPQIAQENITHSVYGVIKWGALTRRYKKASPYIFNYHCRRIRLGGLKLWALNRAGIPLYLRRGWQSLLHSKEGTATHLNSPLSEYYSLGHWGNTMRLCYKELQRGKIPHCPLPQDQIRRLEVLGFEWSRRWKWIVIEFSHVVYTQLFSLADVAIASYLLYVPQYFKGVNLSRWPNVI